MTSEVTHCRCMGLCLGFHPAPFSSVTGLFRASVRIWFWPRVSDSSVHIWFWPRVSDSSVHIWFWPRVSDSSVRIWFWPRVSDSSVHIWSGHAFLIPVSASGSGHAFMTAAVLQYSLRLGSLTIAALSFFPTRFGYLQSSVFPQKLYIFPSSSTKNAFEAKRVLIH